MAQMSDAIGPGGWGEQEPGPAGGNRKGSCRPGHRAAGRPGYKVAQQEAPRTEARPQPLPGGLASLFGFPLAVSSACGQTGSLQFSVLWVPEATRSSQPGARLQ